MTRIYTDGACSGNPGPGGWAWAIAPDGVVFGDLGVLRLRRVSSWRPVVCFEVKPVGKPDAGNPHVRFDERGWETGRRSSVSARARPRLYQP